MKHQPLAFRSLLLGLALAATPALAQQPVQPPPAPEAPQVPAPKVLTEVDLKGVNLGEAAEYLSELAGTNIVVATDAKKLAVPTMRLRNVTSIGVLNAIARAGVPIMVSDRPSEEPGEAPVWVIHGLAELDRTPNQTKIFNLRFAMPFSPESLEASKSGEGQTPEMFKQITQEITAVVLTALEARAQSTGTDPEPPVVKVHESTRLMIVSGKPEEVNIAQQVICSLGGQPIQ